MASGRRNITSDTKAFVLDYAVKTELVWVWYSTLLEELSWCNTKAFVLDFVVSRSAVSMCALQQRGAHRRLRNYHFGGNKKPAGFGGLCGTKSGRKKPAFRRVRV